jgi:hypothetical protein
MIEGLTASSVFLLCDLQEFAPSDEEFAALRAGEDWDPEKAARLKAAKQVYIYM